MKRSVFFITLLFLTSTLNCQDILEGNWYMVSRNRVIEIIFSKDSLISKQLDWDLTDRVFNNKPDAKKIYNVVKANGNIYLYVGNLRDTIKQLSLTIFKIVQPNKELMFVVNAPDHSFADTTAAREYIEHDSKKKYGLTLYSEKEIHRLQKQKSIVEMTTQDFTAYVDKILHFRTSMDSLYELPNPPKGLLYYGYSMLRNFIGQLGYNPLVTEADYGKLIQRFQNNPDTKSIVAKLFE